VLPLSDKFKELLNTSGFRRLVIFILHSATEQTNLTLQDRTINRGPKVVVQHEEAVGGENSHRVTGGWCVWKKRTSYDKIRGRKTFRELWAERTAIL
jgi:hypothetical protein